MALTKHEYATKLTQMGLRVFPLVPNSKLPAVKKYFDVATTSADSINAWWGESAADDYNIGVLTGGDLAVLDIDRKNGRDGYAALEEIALDDIPATFAVRTPSGGMHLYFRTGSEIRNSASRIAAGVDVRGYHGYVAGPGSTVAQGTYVIESDAGVESAPSWLTSRFRPAAPKLDQPPASPIDLDTPSAIARATSYLCGAEPAIEGNGGDETAFKVAAAIKDYGISESCACELMLTWWAERCSTSLGPTEFADYIAAKVKNAYAYGNKPIGSSSPQMDFEPITEASIDRKLYFERYADVGVETGSNYLIENYLDQGAFSVIYGESHAGKTFIALDMSFHIAAGRTWNGLSVAQGAVVYVAAEGGRGIRKRIAALRKGHGAPDVPLALVPCGINLIGRQNDVDALCALIDEAALAMKQPIALVIVDTLSRAMAGANENAPEDMTGFVKSVDRIRAKTGAHLMVVHHAGKDTAKGARGHSSLRAATDTELEVADDSLAVRKQRDGEHEATRPFSLVSIPLGTDDRGKEITSCIVKWADAADDFAGVKMTKDEQACLDALTAACADQPDGVSGALVVDAYEAAGHPAMPLKTVQRALVALEQKRVIRRQGAGRWSRWAPL